MLTMCHVGGLKKKANAREGDLTKTITTLDSRINLEKIMIKQVTGEFYNV